MLRAWHESDPTARLRGVTLALIRATHPEPAAAVTVVAGLLALTIGHSLGSTALVTATVAASQLAVGWSNDAIDASRDRQAGRVDKPISQGRVSRRTVAVAAAAAAAATVALALPFGALATAAVTAGLVSALAYNWPLKSTVLSPLPYLISFAALPGFVVLALPGTPPAWMLLAGALLGAGAHFANVLPDLADDAATGVRGAPHRLGRQGSELVASGLLLAATGVLVAGPPGRPAWWAWAGAVAVAVILPAGWYAARRAAAHGRRSAALFRAFLVAAVINVSLLFAGT